MCLEFWVMDDPIHNVVFCTGLRDRIHIKGRHKGRKKPYWLETTTRRFFPNAWSECCGSGILGRNTVYSKIRRELGSAEQVRAHGRDKKKTSFGCMVAKGTDV